MDIQIILQCYWGGLYILKSRYIYMETLHSYRKTVKTGEEGPLCFLHVWIYTCTYNNLFVTHFVTHYITFKNRRTGHFLTSQKLCIILLHTSIMFVQTCKIMSRQDCILFRALYDELSLVGDNRLVHVVLLLTCMAS